MVKRSVPENLGRFERILVYRGAGLGRFHCMYREKKSKFDIYIYTVKPAQSDTSLNRQMPKPTLNSRHR